MSRKFADVAKQGVVVSFITVLTKSAAQMYLGKSA
jgi:hypothetical protein